MSRLTATKTADQKITVVYGLDHVLGWFYEEHKDDEKIVDLDGLFTGLGKGQLVELLEKTDAPKACVAKVALDLDPALS